jgi:hypothetical protein
VPNDLDVVCVSELTERSIEIGFANRTPRTNDVRPNIDSNGFRRCVHDFSNDLTK